MGSHSRMVCQLLDWLRHRRAFSNREAAVDPIAAATRQTLADLEREFDQEDHRIVNVVLRAALMALKGNLEYLDDGNYPDAPPEKFRESLFTLFVLPSKLV